LLVDQGWIHRIIGDIAQAPAQTVISDFRVHSRDGAVSQDHVKICLAPDAQHTIRLPREATQTRPQTCQDNSRSSHHSILMVPAVDELCVAQA
jgi:hypothetical protein